MKKKIIFSILIVELIIIVITSIYCYEVSNSYNSKDEKKCETIRKHTCTKEISSDNENYILTNVREFESDLDGTITKDINKEIFTYTMQTLYENAKKEFKDEEKYEIEYDDSKMQIILKEKDTIVETEEKWYVFESLFLQDQGYKCNSNN